MVQAQCPWNRVNCSHGCGRHFDENGDGFCDYSIIEKTAVNKVDSTKNQNVVETKTSKKDTIVSKAKINKTQNSKQSQTVAEISPYDSSEKTMQIDTTSIIQTSQNDSPPSKSKPYNLILISLITFSLYTITYLLSIFGKIKMKIHRRIWNVILLLTFLVSCLFGFFLVIQINYQLAIDWFRTVLYWHVQIGISMTIIAVFHIFWHTKYFSKIFSKP